MPDVYEEFLKIECEALTAVISKLPCGEVKHYYSAQLVAHKSDLICYQHFKNLQEKTSDPPASIL